MTGSPEPAAPARDRVARWIAGSAASPLVLGAVFAGALDGDARRRGGVHYTSEADVLAVVRSLFLDGLQERLAATERLAPAARHPALEALHDEIAQMRLLDPACGCGSFLVVAYRELRLVERRLLEAADGRLSRRVGLHQIFGIEIDPWSARVAVVALALAERQLGAAACPAAPRIVVGNALALDWGAVLPATDCTHVLGNPPFVGKHRLTPAQSADLARVWGDRAGVGRLDYAGGWFCKAAAYAQGTRIVTAFVATSSVCQGEQVGVLFPCLFERYGVKLHFAHRTSAWAGGDAHVHVVVVGFAAFDAARKHILEGGACTEVGNIGPYLVEGPDRAVLPRRTPLGAVPPCVYGSKPVDGGHLVLGAAERDALLAAAPAAAPFVRRLLGAQDLLDGSPRWCLWLEGAAPPVAELPAVRDRIAKVAAFRAASDKPATRKLAAAPGRFAEIRQPDVPYLVIPQHTSERRRYVPFAFVDPSVILHNSCSAVPGADLWHFGVLSSAMHMAWARLVCGRIRSDLRYSGTLAYNTFPWPDDPSPDARERVTRAAQEVLDARASRPDVSLADLYGPLGMDPGILSAHQALDRAVDRCYHPAPFARVEDRQRWLLARYEALISAPTARRRGPTRA